MTAPTIPTTPIKFVRLEEAPDAAVKAWEIRSNDADRKLLGLLEQSKENTREWTFRPVKGKPEPVGETKFDAIRFLKARYADLLAKPEPKKTEKPKAPARKTAEQPQKPARKPQPARH